MMSPNTGLLSVSPAFAFPLLVPVTQHHRLLATTNIHGVSLKKAPFFFLVQLS